MPVRSFSQADMVLTKRRRLERPLLAMIWLGAAALSTIEGAALYLLVTTAVVGANVVAGRRNREIYVRRGLINAAVLLASMVLLAELLLGNKDVKLALGHYLILIQLCKLFERKANRDYVQLLILSGLVMIVATLLCSELWFAVVLVAYLALACYSAMVFTLKRGLDAAARATLATEPGPIEPHQVARNVTRRWPGRTLRRYLVISLAGMLIVGVILFLVAPRGKLWDLAGIGPLADSSMSAPPKLGQARNITLSNRAVMRVTQRGGRVSPYMRGKVFYSYKNSRWSSTGIGWWVEPATADNTDLIAEAVVQEITMAPHLLPTLFVAQPALRVESDEGTVRSFGENWQLAMRERPDRSIRYRVRVLPAVPGDRAARHTTHLWPPGINPRKGVEVKEKVRKLAETWCADLIDDHSAAVAPSDETAMLIAARLAERLKQRCTYALDLTDASGDRDGIEDFLFHLRRGHCEYFASALTVMCRHLGVRARLATGFRPEAGGQDGTCIVRQRDGHAWTEVYLRSRGWVVFDATPAGGAGAAETGTNWLSSIWASLESFWQEKVLEYDSLTRRSLAKWLYDTWSAATQAVARAAGDLKMSLGKLLVSGKVDRALFHLAIAICLLGLAIEIVLVVRITRRRGRRNRLIAAGQAVPWKQFEFARRLFALFEKHAQRRRGQQTPRQWAREAAETLKLHAGHVDELVDLYYRLRWGRLAAGGDELVQAAGRVDRFASQLAG